MEGVANSLSLGKESSWGVAVVPTVSIAIKPSNGLTVNQDLISIEGINTKPSKNKLMALGKRNYKGSYTVPAYPTALGFLLGAVSVDTPATVETGAVYTHTFIDNITKPAYTVEQYLSAVSTRYAGVNFISFKISGKAGEEIDIAVDVIGKTQATAGPITQSYETNRPFNFGDITSLSIGGTDIKAKVTSFEIDYTSGLDHFWGMGAVEPAKAYAKQSECKGKLTLYLDSVDVSYFADLIAKTERAIVLTITGDAIGTSHFNTLVITLSQCDFSKFNTKFAFDYNAVDIEFEAREDATNGIFKAVLTNTTATYAV